MASRRFVPQAALFAEPDAADEASVDVVFLPASTQATEVHDLALRKQDGDLRNVRHPVEMSAIEPKTRKLTYLSHKLWMFLVSYSLQVKGTMTDLGILWRIPLSTLQHDIEYRSNDTAYLKESIRQCQRTLVEWASSARDRDSGEVRSWTSTQLLGSVEFVVDRRGIKCLEWTFPPPLLRQMQDHKHWFESSLQIANQLTRHSSLALFRVVSRYKTSPSGLTERRPWREWIPILTGESDESAALSARLRAKKTAVGDAPAGKPEKYKEWRYFNRDVVATAVKELNQVLDDIWVEARPIKVGGSVDSLQFKVTHRNEFKRLSASGEITPEHAEAVDALTRLGLAKTLAAQLCKEHTADLMLVAARTVAARIGDARQPPVRNVQGLLITVKDELVAEQLAGKGAVAKAPRRQQTAEAMVSESLEDYRSDLADRARRDWPGMPPEVQADYLARFKADGIPKSLKVAHDHFAKSGIKEPMVRGLFFRWLACDRAGNEWTASDRVLLAFERARRAR